MIGAVPRAVTPEEFARATHVAELANEDALALGLLLDAAQSVVERAANRPLGPRLAEFAAYVPLGARRWWFPCAPVVSIEAVSIDGAAVDLGAVSLRGAHNEPCLQFAGGAPDCELIVRAVVGEEVGSVSVAPLRQAIILIAQEWRLAGISVGGDGGAQGYVSFGAQALIRQARYARPSVFERGAD